MGEDLTRVGGPTVTPPERATASPASGDPSLGQTLSRLLHAAIDDRAKRPWRYYQLDYEDLRRGLDIREERIDALVAMLKAVVTPLGGGSWTNLTGENAQKALALLASVEGR